MVVHNYAVHPHMTARNRFIGSAAMNLPGTSCRPRTPAAEFGALLDTVESTGAYIRAHLRVDGRQPDDAGVHAAGPHHARRRRAVLRVRLVVPAMRESLFEDGRPLSSGRASPWATCRVLPPGSPTTGEVLSP
jgi:hypothetical protein